MYASGIPIVGVSTIACPTSSVSIWCLRL